MKIDVKESVGPAYGEYVVAVDLDMLTSGIRAMIQTSKPSSSRGWQIFDEVKPRETIYEMRRQQRTYKSSEDHDLTPFDYDPSGAIALNLPGIADSDPCLWRRAPSVCSRFPVRDWQPDALGVGGSIMECSSACRLVNMDRHGIASEGGWATISAVSNFVAVRLYLSQGRLPLSGSAGAP